MIQKLLSELGLSEYESKVYLSLLDLGDSVAGKIAQKAKVNRRNVYDALDRLIKKGFVSSHLKNNTKHYSPTNPKKIIELYEERVALAKEALPELIANFNKNTNQREVHFFEGKNGMKTIFNKFIEQEETIHVIGSTGKSIEHLPFFMYQLSKKSKKIKIKELWNHDAENYQKVTKLFNSENRILPKKMKTSTQIFISGNASVILTWSSNPLAILIIDKEVSDGFKNYFNFLWELSKVV